jgi:hypothetical protein
MDPTWQVIKHGLWGTPYGQTKPETHSIIYSALYKT